MNGTKFTPREKRINDALASVAKEIDGKREEAMFCLVATLDKQLDKYRTITYCEGEINAIASVLRGMMKDDEDVMTTVRLAFDKDMARDLYLSFVDDEELEERV